MNRTLKNAAAFFFATALLALCYPQIGNGISIAQELETLALINVESNDIPTEISDKNGDEKDKVTTDSKTSSSMLAETKVEPVSSSGTAYAATAYALRGRTASGSGVRRGIIAADPRVLPLGTQVLISAGAWSGTYVVADTGGAIRGRKIDVRVPSNAEARKFGRRKITLTVLQKTK